MVSKIKQARASYDFTKHGGAVSAITLNLNIPTGAWIIRWFIVKKTTLTSGGSATVALAIGGLPLLGAVAISDTIFTSAVGGSTASAVGLTTTAAKFTATIATAALTAGAFDVIVEYVY